MKTRPPNAAAGEHFADAERILAALPLVKARAERDRHVPISRLGQNMYIPGGGAQGGGAQLQLTAPSMDFVRDRVSFGGWP
jgi:hypothetical protein